MSPLASRPSYKSQCGRILRLLERHPNQWILNGEIYAVCGSMGALHSRMAELRSVWGFNIVCESNRTRTRYKLVTLSEGIDKGPPVPATVPSLSALSEGGAGLGEEPQTSSHGTAASVPPPSLSVPPLEPQAAGDGSASSRPVVVNREASKTRSAGVGEQLRIESA
jgi:hypothetical protein